MCSGSFLQLLSDDASRDRGGTATWDPIGAPDIDWGDLTVADLKQLADSPLRYNTGNALSTT